MSNENFDAKCSPADCASCTSNCSSNLSGNHSTITLTMDDDTEVTCAILTVFPVEKNEYIALLPLDENGQNHEGEVYLYKFSRTENGDPMLENIEDDDEYMAVADAFDEVLEKSRQAEENGEPLE